MIKGIRPRVLDAGTISITADASGIPWLKVSLETTENGKPALESPLASLGAEFGELPIGILSDDIDEVLVAGYRRYSPQGKPIAKCDGDSCSWFVTKTGEALATPRLTKCDGEHLTAGWQTYGALNCILAIPESTWGVYRLSLVGRDAIERLYGSLVHVQQLTFGRLRGLDLRLTLRPTGLVIELSGRNLLEVQTHAAALPAPANVKSGRDARVEYLRQLLELRTKPAIAAATPLPPAPTSASQAPAKPPPDEPVPEAPFDEEDLRPSGPSGSVNLPAEDILDHAADWATKQKCSTCGAVGIHVCVEPPKAQPTPKEDAPIAKFPGTTLIVGDPHNPMLGEPYDHGAKLADGSPAPFSGTPRDPPPPASAPEANQYAAGPLPPSDLTPAPQPTEPSPPPTPAAEPPAPPLTAPPVAEPWTPEKVDAAMDQATTAAEVEDAAAHCDPTWTEVIRAGRKFVHGRALKRIKAAKREAANAQAPAPAAESAPAKPKGNLGAALAGPAVAKALSQTPLDPKVIGGRGVEKLIVAARTDAELASAEAMIDLIPDPQEIKDLLRGVVSQQCEVHGLRRTPAAASPKQPPTPPVLDGVGVSPAPATEVDLEAENRIVEELFADLGKAENSGAPLLEVDRVIVRCLKLEHAGKIRPNVSIDFQGEAASLKHQIAAETGAM